MSKKKNKFNDYLVVIANDDYDLDKALRELAKNSKKKRCNDDVHLRGEENNQTQSKQEDITDTIEYLKRNISFSNHKVKCLEYKNQKLKNVIKDLKGTIKTLNDNLNIIEDKLHYTKDIINKLNI